MVDWYNVFIIFLFLCLLTVLFIIYRLCANTVPAVNANFCNIKEELKTGDILLVPYDSIYGHLVKIFRGCCWTHASLVYKKNNKIYIIEIARYENSDYKDLIMIPFDEWLEFNKGRPIGYLKYKGNVPSNNKILTTFNKYKNVKVNLDVIYWMNTLFKQKYQNINKNKYFCTEFIAKFLQDVNMISKKYSPCNYSPITFSELKEYSKDVKIFDSKWLDD